MIHNIGKYIVYGLLVILLLPSSTAFSQSSSVIKGVVTSASDGLELLGATVAEIDKDNRIVKGVITDFNGNYVINVSNTSNRLQFSFIGHTSTTLSITQGQKVINVVLEESSRALDEVVIEASKIVNTGEFNMSSERVATAMQTISAKEISESVSSSVVDQLQGQLSGVDIVAASGEPGAGMSIRIRGTSSLNASSEPLIVINGIPFATSVDDSFDFGSADEDEYASLIGVSPDDIDEISVLKDAAATAQYGSSAANGVLLIKTKRGTRGKAMFSYTYKGTIGFQPDGIPMLNGDQYSTLIKDEVLNIGDRNSDEKNNVDQISYNPEYEFYDLYNQNVNWVDEITQMGKINEHNFSISGGGEKATYRISSSYKNQEGTTVGSANELFTLRSIMDYNISNKLRISTELAYSHGDLDKSYKDIRALALLKMPNQSIYELDEDGNSTGAYFTPEDAFQGSGTKYYNPVAMAELSEWNVKNNRITPTFRLTYKPVHSLSYDGIVSYDASNNSTTKFTPEEAMGVAWTSSSANNSYFGDSEFFSFRTENRLTWKPQLNENHSLFVAGKFITYDKTSRGYTVNTSNSPSNDLQSVVVPARVEGSGNSISSSYTRNTSVAYNFSFNYQYLNRYILSGGMRWEGNSRFGEDYRYGAFPSIAGKWIMSNEKYLRDINWLDELSMRGSFGINGNSPSFNYGAYNIYSTYNYNYIDVRPAYPSSVELTGLRWETIIQQNLGFNLEFFNHRVNADVEFYKKQTKDMLSKNTSIPTTSGYSRLNYLNQGDIDNNGWEVSVMTKVVKKKDFKFDFNFNLSRNKNTIKKLTDGMETESGNALSTGSDGYLKRIQEDNPIGSFYGYRSLGVYSTSEELYARDADGGIIYDISGEAKMMKFNNSKLFEAGDAKYEDVNHDGNINRLDVVYLGNANPLLYGGFGPNFTYKNFRLNVFFNFRYKQDVINLARMSTESMDSYDNQSTAVLRRWRFEGDETDIPRAYYNSTVNTLASDRFLEDASFLRMKYITLRYTVPKALTKKYNISKLSFYVTGTNLLTFTEYTGSDPETGSSSNWEKLGYDTNKTPRSQQYTLGMNVSF